MSNANGDVESLHSTIENEFFDTESFSDQTENSSPKGKSPFVKEDRKSFAEEKLQRLGNQ